MPRLPLFAQLSLTLLVTSLALRTFAAVPATSLNPPAPSPAQATAGVSVSSGIPEIDAMRRDFRANPTTPANALQRQSLIFSWVRLLVHRGVDMTDFHAPCADFSVWGPIAPARYPAMQTAFEALERIQDSPRFIEEIRGKPGARPTATTDWPLFQSSHAQAGVSPDAGPQTGEIAWKFPIGLSWYAAPAVENGRVYVASPGVTTLLYCLNAKSGAVHWKTRQDGLQIYSTPRGSSTPLLLQDHVALRATSGSWEFTEKVKQVYLIDKQTGRIDRQIDAGRVDYRRGIAPLQGNADFLVYPWSRLDLRGMPAVVRMQDTVVVRTAAGEPWWTLCVGAMFGDPIVEGDHVYAPTEAGTLHALNLRGPQRIAWTLETGAPLRSTPVVAGETVYCGAQDGTVLAVNRADGRIRWSVCVNQGEPRAFQLFSRPTVHGNRLFIGSATRELCCLDAQTGQLLWRAPTSDWIRARPVVVNGRVYAAGLDGRVAAFSFEGRPLWSASAGAHPILADLVGSEDGLLVSSSGLFLYSLSLADGRLQWRHSLLECVYDNGNRILADVVAGGGDYQSPPTVSQGRMHIGGPDRFARAIDPATGREVWRFETSGQVSGAVTVQDGRAFFGQQGGNDEMYCVSAQDGAPIWKSNPGWVWTTSTPDGDRVITGTVEGTIAAVATADGRVIWKRTTNGGVYPSPAVGGGLVYTGSWDGYYYALDRGTGRIEWCYATEGRDYAFGGGPDSAAAILWKGNLICRVAPHTLIALDQRTGKPRWQFQDTTRARPRLGMNATPSAAGNRVFVSTSIDHDGMPCGGRLFCLDDATGKIVWHYTGAGGWTGSSCTPEAVLCGSSTDVFMNSIALEPGPNGAAQVRWRTRVGSIFQESIPAIYGNQAFILCSDGFLYAFR